MSALYRNTYGDYVACAFRLVRLPPTKLDIIYIAAFLMGKEIAEVGLKLLQTIDQGVTNGLLQYEAPYLYINYESTARFPNECVFVETNDNNDAAVSSDSTEEYEYDFDYSFDYDDGNEKQDNAPEHTNKME